MKKSLRFHCTSIRIGNMNKTNDSPCWGGCRIRGIFIGKANLYNHYDNHVPQKDRN